MSSSRFGTTIAETGTDATTETIGESKVVLGILEKLEEESLGLVADVTIVLLVEAGGQDGVGEFSLVAPVV